MCLWPSITFPSLLLRYKDTALSIHGMQQVMEITREFRHKSSFPLFHCCALQINEINKTFKQRKYFRNPRMGMLSLGAWVPVIGIWHLEFKWKHIQMALVAHFVITDLLLWGKRNRFVSWQKTKWSLSAPQKGK